ncbi:hypothetical protein J1614_003343 [Plenodomus biglobosus]|nr:hypothetical protein J1614_003343 [Plenodomus biglobosus]
MYPKASTYLRGGAFQSQGLAFRTRCCLHISFDQCNTAVPVSFHAHISPVTANPPMDDSLAAPVGIRATHLQYVYRHHDTYVCPMPNAWAILAGYRSLDPAMHGSWAGVPETTPRVPTFNRRSAKSSYMQRTAHAQQRHLNFPGTAQPQLSSSDAS